MAVRFTREEELERINELRKQVNDVHVEGKPEVFKPGFGPDLRDHIFWIWDDPEHDIVVNERDGVICGFAVLSHIIRPANPFMFERNFIDIDEFCVDKDFRRKGVGSEMVEFIKAVAARRGIKRIELNMWEFNESALEFYEAAGFKTFRRYMEMFIE